MTLDMVVMVRDVAVDGGRVAVLVRDFTEEIDPVLGDEPDRVQSVAPMTTTATVSFRRIPAGRYAVVVFQLAQLSQAEQLTLYNLPVAQIGSAGSEICVGEPLSTRAIDLKASAIIIIPLKPISRHRTRQIDSFA